MLKYHVLGTFPNSELANNFAKQLNLSCAALRTSSTLVVCLRFPLDHDTLGSVGARAY